MRSTHRCLALVLFSTAFAEPAHAQCAAEWLGNFGMPIPNDAVNALLEFDDGSGPSLFVAGPFESVGGVVAHRIARWGPTTGWSDLAGGILNAAGGLDSGVQALAVYDDGRGAALYACGEMTSAGGVPASGIARWDGTAWEPLGSGLGGAINDVRAHSMCVHDDGSGSKLYVGGNFTSAGGVPASKLARWDGTTWESVGAGIDGPQGHAVYALASFFDPVSNTSMLYAGGEFPGAIGVLAPSIVRWNGASYEPVIGGANGIVYALRTFDDGSGNALYAGGSFTAIGGALSARAARFDGAAWSDFGTTQSGGLGNTGAVKAFASVDTGGGARLAIAGSLRIGNSVSGSMEATWDGATLAPIAGGPIFNGEVRALASITLAGTSRLVVGGSYFQVNEGRAGRLTTHDGTAWALLDGTPGGLLGPSFSSPHAFQSVDHGGAIGVRHYVGGRFDVAGGAFARSVAVLEGGVFRSIGNVTNVPASDETTVYAMQSYDFGTGNELVVTGDFTHAGGLSSSRVARFDGSAWHAMPPPVMGQPRALRVHDEGLGAGPQLYVTGTAFTYGNGPVSRWNGAGWDVLPPILGPGIALASHDDGTGPALYFAGSPTATVERVQRWDGSTWTPIGAGLSSLDNPRCLAVHDRGNGPELFLGMYSGVLRAWDGSQWNLVADLGREISAMQSHDDGSGAALYLGGSFTNIGGASGDGIVRWNGTSFQALGGGTFGSVHALGVLTFREAPTLFVGGLFSSAQNLPGATTVSSMTIAAWGTPCPPASVAFCSGDGTATACPCGNAGASSHGCANSFDANGARLVASGVARVSADTWTLDASGVSNSIVTFLQGSLEHNGGLGAVFGDGLRCAGGSLIRLGTVQAAANAAQYPSLGQQPVSLRGAIPLVGNVTRTYQVWYRNGVAFCTPSTFNLTNGLRTFWAP